MWQPDTTSPDALYESIRRRMEDCPIGKADDREQALRLLDDFRAALDDRARLLDIAAEAFVLEKRYMAAENKAALPPPIPGAVRMMIATVGNTPQPIILNLLSVSPRRVFLLPSHAESSRDTAEAVIRDEHVARRNIEFETHPISEDAAAESYGVISALLNRLGGDVDLWADPTGGRKMMVAALATAAFHRRLPTVYLHAPEQEGVVWPFSGVLRVVENPYAHFDDIAVQTVVNLFNAGAYDEAARVCEALRESSRNAAFRRWMWALRDLCAAYGHWDSFAHSRAQAAVALSPRISRALGDLGDTLPAEAAAQARRNVAFLERLEARTQPGANNMCDEFRLVDILAAAKRRAAQGRHDDAVARLYRAAEMAVSIALLQLGLGSVERPDYESFAREVGRAVGDLVEPNRLDSPLGLEQQVSLLEKAGRAQPLTDMYRDLKDRRDLFTRRNRSILAHGTDSIQREDCEELAAGVREMARLALPPQERLEELLADARHPRLGALCWRC